MGTLKGINKFSHAEQILGKDPIWYELEIQRDREGVFQEYLCERASKEIVEKNLERQEKKNSLKIFLKNCEWLNIITEWRKACQRLERVLEFEICCMLDCLETFKEIMGMHDGILKKNSEEEKIIEIRQERKRRDGFKKLLRWYVQ